ncbi:MAG: cupin domain-containing protein [Pseudomonadales bacterium]|nr:cupin domain-containing protein [Pseudomonadales bacterium]
MTRLRVSSFLLVFAAGLLVGIAIPLLSYAAKSKVTNLLTTALSTEFTPEREVLIDIVEIPPNQKLDWHWHPGEEFHYYLEGNPVIELADAAPIVGKPGTVGHVKFKQRHQATAGDQGAKILVFRVHTKGQAWRYLDAAHDHDVDK